MKKIAFSLISMLFALSLQAQTKVFKEVGEDITTEIKAITQDNALVGYLAFTRLEKADANSFNYRLTIMDENLNDIGAVNFRQESLDIPDRIFRSKRVMSGLCPKPAGRRGDGQSERIS